MRACARAARVRRNEMLPDGRGVLRRAELAARGKCWIDGECAQAQPHGGGGAGWPRAWLSHDDVEDAYHRLRVRCNARAWWGREGGSSIP